MYETVVTAYRIMIDLWSYINNVHVCTHQYTPVWHKDEYDVIIGIKLDIGLSSLMLLYLDRKAEVLGWNRNPAIFFHYIIAHPSYGVMRLMTLMELTESGMLIRNDEQLGGRKEMDKVHGQGSNL